jgi:(E)-4-hydroxy-3-methylbut-2-enyl-diphosphate synthase
VNVLELTRKVQRAIEAERFAVPIRVAVMGCVVNGPGEAREADVGIAAGNGLGFVVRQGEVVAKVSEDELVAAVLAEARTVAAEKVAAGAGADD